MAAAYDYIVIGGGSGGLASAHIAHSVYKKKILIIEGGKIGGTCVNVGCVPKKVMWNAAALLDDLKSAPGYGVTASASLDWGVLQANREHHISTINQGYYDWFKEDKIECIAGWASFIDAHTVSVNGSLYTAPHILVATGSSNYVPDVAVGKELIGTSDDFFLLKEAPKKVLILGNGYIAAELAGLFGSFRIDTTIAVRTDKFLRVFDDDLGSVLKETMEHSGIRFLMKTEVVSVVKSPDGRLLVTFTTGATDTFDKVFAAIGRVGNVKHLNPEAAGLTVDKNSFIPSDEYENTNVSGVYAIGDVSGKVQLTPVAIAAGTKLAHRVFGGQPESKLRYDCIPTVMFSHPALGTIGLSEREARVKYSDVKVYKTRFNSMYYALSDHKVPTFMKLVVAGPEERVVGLHALGRGVDEMIQGFGVAMRMGATKKDFDSTIAIHPTASEEFVTLS